MKNIIKPLIALFAIFTIASCSTDDVEDRPVISGIDAPVLLAPDNASSYVLTIENAAILAERFVWSPANFGQNVAVNYEVELDSLNGDFSTPRSLGSVVGANQLSVSVVTLNNAVIALGGEPTVESQYKVRVKASVNESFEAMFSEPVTITVTPYQAFVPLQNLYIVGTATEFGFDNNAGNIPMFRDSENQFLFHLRAYFNAGELKLLGTLGAWQPQYGTNDGTTLANSENGDPGAINVANAGYYDFTVNLDEMTFSLVSFDASSATLYSLMGIIGDSTPGAWDTDTDMISSTTNPHIWKVMGISLTQAEAKFRTNDSWNENWGGGPATQGIAQLNSSGNIPVAAAGTYNVWFNDLDQRYIFIMN
jgi:hypothetical protein